MTRARQVVGGLLGVISAAGAGAAELELRVEQPPTNQLPPVPSGERHVPRTTHLKSAPRGRRTSRRRGDALTSLEVMR